MLPLVFTFINVLIAFVFPFGVLLYTLVKRPGYRRAFAVGALTFLVSQLLTRMPLLQLWLQKTAWFNAFALGQPVLYLFFLSCTAGLFEECGRYLFMRLLLKRQLNWQNGVFFGLGHGGLEAAVIVGLPALIALVAQRPALQAQWPAGIALGGAERIFAITFHLAASLLVMAAVRRRKPALLVASIALHTLFNFAPLLILRLSGSLWATEAAAGALALVLLVGVVKAKGRLLPSGARPHKTGEELWDETKTG